MIGEILIIGLQIATLVAMSGKKEAEEPKEAETPKTERVETKVAQRREPKISNSGERFVACPLEGYQSYYLVGDLGTVKRADGLVLKPFKNKYGKLTVAIRNKTMMTQYTVERLVALAYLVRPAHDSGKTHRILHKNGNADDNRAVNLMWK